MIKYNLDYLLKIKVEDFRDVPLYQYQDYEYKVFNKKYGDPGFYADFLPFKNLDNIDTDKEIILGSRYMYKPRVLLCFVDRTVVEYYFQSLGDAEKFRDEIIEKTGKKDKFL